MALLSAFDQRFSGLGTASSVSVFMPLHIPQCPAVATSKIGVALFPPVHHVAVWHTLAGKPVALSAD
eukprot:1264056-Pyramimonas_sp.AAC.1